LAAAALAAERLASDSVQVGALRDRLERTILATVERQLRAGRYPEPASRHGRDGIRRRRWRGDSLPPQQGRHRRLGGLGLCLGRDRAQPCGASDGVPFSAAYGVLRFSLSRETTAAEIDRLIGVLPEIVAEARAGAMFAPRQTAASR
jgi:cysteine desulfurase